MSAKLSRQEKPVDDLMEDIRYRIKELIDKAGLSQTGLAEELEGIREEILPNELKPITRNDIENIQNGGKHITAQYLILLSKHFDVSTDEILLGCPPQDRKNLEEYRLSPKALIALRNHDYAGEMLSFFMDNDLIPVLAEIKKYIEKEYWIADNGMIDSQLLDENDLIRFRFVENLKKWKSTYWKNKSKKGLKAQKEGSSSEQKGKR